MHDYVKQNDLGWAIVITNNDLIAFTFNKLIFS